MKRILLLFLVLMCAINIYASHISGGELTYEYLGPGADANTDRFKITMHLYRDCHSEGAALNGEDVNVGVYYSAGNRYFTQVHLDAEWDTSQEPPFIRNNPDAIPCLIGDKEVCFQLGLFSNTIDLPKNSTGYTLSWTRYSRQELTNVNDEPYPTNAFGAIFITHIPGTTLLGPTGVNSSPKFKTKDTALVCAGKEFTIDYSATDIDGDSLSYSFCPAFYGGSDLDKIPDPSLIDPLILNQLPYIGPTYSGYSPLGSLTKINAQTKRN